MRCPGHVPHAGEHRYPGRQVLLWAHRPSAGTDSPSITVDHGVRAIAQLDYLVVR